MKEFGKDLTRGNTPGKLLQFALPLLAGNLLSTGYSIINAIWVGNLLGRDAVGAIAVSFPVFLCLIALCSGATLATSILIANAYGAKENEKIRKIVNASCTIAVVMILFVTLCGVLFAEPLLVLLGTPPEILDQALGYLRITMCSFPTLYLSFLVASVLRGIGDTTIPMFFVMLSTLFNAILDPVLIIGLGPFPALRLAGAAYASLLATGVSTVLGIAYVKRKYKGQPIDPSGLSGDRKLITAILSIGFPAFIQQMLVSVGYACITSFVNGFGASATAAFGIAGRIDAIVVMPASAMMMSVSAMTAQNLGAGKRARIGAVFGWGILLNAPAVLLIAAFCVGMPETVMHLFVKDPEVIRIGAGYLSLVGKGYLFFIVFYISNGILTGAGRTVSTMTISFVSLCLVRIPLAAVLSRTTMGLSGIWTAIVLSFEVTTLCSLVYYLSGRWDIKRDRRSS